MTRPCASRLLLLVLAASLRAFPGFSQIGGIPSGAHAPAAPEAAPVEEDAYGRETPRGCFLGFVKAAEKGNDVVASEYLQWPVRGLRETKIEIARQLKYVLDVGYEGRLMSLSQSPQGDLDDGLAAPQELVGEIVAGDERVDVLLVRVPQKQGHSLWFISANTLREVPKLYEAVGFPALERRLPAFLVDTTIAGFALWKLLAFVLGIPLLFTAVWFLLTGVLFVTRKLRRRKEGAVGAREWAAAVRAPLALLISIVLTGLLMRTLGIPIVSRFWLIRILIPLFFLSLIWLIFRVLDVIARHATERVAAAGARTPMRGLGFGLRILKVVVFLLAILGMLAAFGVDLTATLAGLGIGGLALAFAAQKSLENLFGGFMVLGGGAIRIGDVCRVGNHLGEVEDITLTSTRLRTNSRTVVNIPNGQMATERVENLSRRDKFWFRHIVGMRYDTTPEQIEKVLAAWRAMFAADPRVDAATARARFLALAASSLDVELFAYVRVDGFDAFLVVQEEMLLRVLRVAAENGVGIAFPSTSVYLEGTGSETEKPPVGVSSPPNQRG
jgi:MscS family membrane protein